MFAYFCGSMTFKKLYSALLFTFALSFLVTLVIGTVYLMVRFKDQDKQQIIENVFKADFYLNMILLIMSAPALFLTNKDLYHKKLFRLTFYFGGCLVFLLAAVASKMRSDNMIFYLAAGLIFLVFHFFSYRRMVREYPPNKN